MCDCVYVCVCAAVCVCGGMAFVIYMVRSYSAFRVSCLNLILPPVNGNVYSDVIRFGTYKVSARCSTVADLFAGDELEIRVSATPDSVLHPAMDTGYCRWSSYSAPQLVPPIMT